MQEVKEKSRAASELSGIIRRLLTERERIVIAIDGRCGSGKTTLGRELQEIWDGNLFRMDDFYLQKEQRTKERYEEPGGNVDYERFEQEVLVPLKKGETVFYRPYYPPKWRFLETAEIAPCRVNIVEGTYSCHERLEAYYDLKVFLTIDPIEQIQRIEKRNGSEKAVEFQKNGFRLRNCILKNAAPEAGATSVLQCVMRCNIKEPKIRYRIFLRGNLKDFCTGFF